MSASKGARNERKTQRYLEAIGYTTCRSAASNGPFDVIAWNETHVLFIQVKSNRPPRPVEMEALEQELVPRSAHKQVWIWKDRAREPIVTKVPR